jgi:hypothetical protein
MPMRFGEHAWIVIIAVCGAARAEPVGDHSFSLTVKPTTLPRGRTTTVTASVTASDRLKPSARLILSAVSDVLVTGSPVQIEHVPRGQPLTGTWSLAVPDDGDCRLMEVIAQAEDSDGRAVERHAILVANPDGVAHAHGRGGGGGMELDLRSSGPLLPGVTTDIIFEATPDIDHPRLEMKLALSESVKVLDGHTSLGPLRVKAGIPVRLKATVRLAKDARLIVINALANLGSPGDGDSLPGGVITIQGQP